MRRNRRLRAALAQRERRSNELERETFDRISAAMGDLEDGNCKGALQNIIGAATSRRVGAEVSRGLPGREQRFVDLGEEIDVQLGDVLGECCGVSDVDPLDAED